MKSNLRRSWPIGFLALVVALAAMATPAWAQKGDQGVSPTSLDYTKSSSFPNVINPYMAPFVPQPRMSNSERLHSLIHDGKLVLSIEDAIALALENNLDIEVARYGPAYAQTDVLRTKSGGTTRGINPALFGGVTAFGAAAGGGSRGGTGGAGGVTGGGGATNVGSVGCCDPFAGVSFGWDQRDTPLNFTVVSGVPVVTTQTSSVSTFYGQGFLTGTSYVVALSGDRQSSSSLNQLFNPQVPTGLTLGFTQHLLNGFGYRANAKFLRIAKNDVRQADSVFRQQVITTVTSVMNLYYDLLAFRENVRVAEHTLALGERLLADNKRQVEIGTLAPIEVVRAESEVATDQQALIVAQTNLQLQQTLLKEALSKVMDPELATASIEPTDTLPEPKSEDIPPLDTALKQAMQNRPELEQSEINLRNQRITIQAARNALLPTFDLFGTYAPVGLSGNRLVCPPAEILPTGGCAVAPALVSAGYAQSLTQVFHGRYPDYSFGATLTIPIRNRAAKADAATALLQERQLQVQMQQSKNQIDQQVRNAEIALIQAKAQIEAADKAVKLAQETLDAEQKKFQLGESTVFLVIQTQRDLAAAEGNAVTAHSAYAKALTQLGQATGTTLVRNHIELSEALSGKVNKNPNIPGTPINP